MPRASGWLWGHLRPAHPVTCDPRSPFWMPGAAPKKGNPAEPFSFTSGAQPSGFYDKGILIWLVEIKGEPFPKKGNKGAGQLGVAISWVVTYKARSMDPMGAVPTPMIQSRAIGCEQWPLAARTYKWHQSFSCCSSSQSVYAPKEWQTTGAVLLMSHSSVHMNPPSNGNMCPNTTLNVNGSIAWRQ